MKKGETWFFAHMRSGSTPFGWARFRNKNDLTSYLGDDATAVVSEIVSMQVTGVWKTEHVVLLVPKVEYEEPNNIGKNPKECCIDIRCLDGDPHYKEDCPHKAEDISCEDARCPVIGPHTIYNCQSIPRCHNPKCDGKQGTHWTKDCSHTEWKDIDTFPRGCTNSKCAMPLADRERKCMRSSCQRYE